MTFICDVGKFPFFQFFFPHLVDKLPGIVKNSEVPDKGFGVRGPTTMGEIFGPQWANNRNSPQDLGILRNSRR